MADMGELGLGPRGTEYDFLSDPPPAPAPGNPLLTEAETNMLHNSMDHMTSASNDYGEHNFGEGLNANDWTDIPSLMGIASGFGVPMQNIPNNNFASLFQNAPTPMDFAALSDLPPSSLSMPPSSLSMPPAVPGNVTTSPQDFAMPIASTFFAPSTPLVTTAPPMNPATPTFSHPNGLRHGPRASPSPMQQHSPDVLEAATVLQGGSHSRSHSMHSISQQRPSNQGMGPPVGHLRHQDMSDFRQERRRMSESIEPSQGDIFVKWAFEGDTFANAPRQPRASAPINLQYGSDVRFNSNQPYLPQSEKESFESLAQEQDRYMKAVTLSNSVDSTRHPSPEFGAAACLSLRTKGRPNSLSLSIDTNGNGRAKRPSLDDAESQLQSQSAASRALGRKRKSSNRASTDSPGVDGSDGKKKRRKSGGVAKKENLTEKQKRENHIKSERKRRGVIDVGFKNLNKMVPALVGQNPSKAATLTSAHEFFVDMAVGNAELRAMLGQM